MQHADSEIKVYQTKDYRRFKNIIGNRNLNRSKIQRIIKDIQSGNDILDHVPILVSEKNGKLEIIDGQHRFEIARKLNRPVHYIIRPALRLDQIAQVNSNVEKWSSKDFIDCYVETGNGNYKIIQEFMGAYSMPLSTTLMLLARGMIHSDSGPHELMEAFRRGQFLVKHQRQAIDVAETCKRFDKFTGWNSRPFVIAICRILHSNLIEIDELVEKFERDPSKLEKRLSAKDYLANLEAIYNIGNRKRRVIFQ